MAFRFSERSERRMQGVHPDMVRVMRRALELSPLDFTVVEGLRSLQRQHELYASGASKTMNSRHLTGHGVDIAPIVGGSISWHWPHYYDLADVVKQAAADCGVTLEWGGDWTSFKDGPHWQLPWDGYPAESYDASKAGAASAASIDPDSLRTDPDAVVEENRDRTGVAAAGATAAGGGVAVSAGLDLRESEGERLAEAQGGAATPTDTAGGPDGADGAPDAGAGDAPAEAAGEASSADAQSEPATGAVETPEPAPQADDAEASPVDAPTQPAGDTVSSPDDASGDDPIAEAGAAEDPIATAPDAAEPVESAEPAMDDAPAEDAAQAADTPPQTPGEAAEPAESAAPATADDAPGDLAAGEPGADQAGEAATGEAATGVLAQAGDLFDRFIASENTLEIIALVLGVVVVMFGLYLLIRRIIRWRRKRRAARRVNKVLGHA
ncbi:MAG: M15 family metallopeptidase [Oceanicaulis sp.]